VTLLIYMLFKSSAIPIMLILLIPFTEMLHALAQIWVLPSLAGMLWMMHLSSGSVELLTMLVYGLGLFLLFAVSTTFHVLAYCGDRFQWVP